MAHNEGKFSKRALKIIDDGGKKDMLTVLKCPLKCPCGGEGRKNGVENQIKSNASKSKENTVWSMKSWACAPIPSLLLLAV